MNDDPSHDPNRKRPGELPDGPDADRDEDGEPDSEETELIAYLDGELDAAGIRRVEAKLAADPQARAKAEVLKKTYDLLDFLPRPEPSATFASRTLDRIPTVGPSASDPSAQRIPSVPNATPPTVPLPTASPARNAAFGSSMLAIPSGSGFVPAVPQSAGNGRWLLGGLVAASLALLLGYFGHAAARTYLFPHPESASLSLEESRLVENLPLYMGVDDFDFLVRLTDSEEFAVEPGAEPNRPLPPAITQAATEQPWGKDLALAKAFKALPTARQDQLRELDRKLYEQPPVEQARLFRVLEEYAVWLYGLAESERKAILAASSPATRFSKIRDIREHEWQAHLPAAHRKLLSTTTDDARRADLIQKWKNDEADRRKNWLLAHKNWETIRAGRIPWPFDHEGMKREVADYVRTVLKVDGTSNGRLNAAEAERFREARDYAEKQGSWLWYGSDIYSLANKYPMLPEPIGEPIVRIDDLPKISKKLGDRKLLRDTAGKWPEFALAVAEDAARAKVSLPLSLGPSRPGQFRKPVNDFLLTTLSPKLTGAEREALKQLEGKWPEYPRKMIELAKQHDLPVPGVTLPGSPRMWDQTYQAPRPAPRPVP